MYIGKTFSFNTMWHFAKINLLRTFINSTIITALYFIFDWKFLAIPFVPIATIGTAVAFYMGFKNNQAYERLWEARKLWGGFTNTSRTLTAQIRSYIPDKDLQKDLLQRHLIYINIVRLQLRRTIVWATNREHLHQSSVADSEELLAYDKAIVKLFADCNKMEIYEQIKDKNNIANNALQHQYTVIHRLKKNGTIDGFEHSDILRNFGELYNLQGACERIKSTPLYRQYSIFSRIFVTLFIFLLPFGLLSTLHELKHIGPYSAWLTIPFSLLISWVFFTMEQIGEFSENPFDNGVNDVPISTICRNIEIDVLEMMGEKNLPEKLQPHNDVLL
ncbi:MAG: bestrophin family ion channel [bacterium]|nr:bestrophin family ion channel [bacterium]